MKNQSHDPNRALEVIKKIENMAGLPAFDLDERQDIKVNIRVNEQVGPAKFKSDPLIPGGYIANSLTVRAMRPDLFMVGNSLDDLSAAYQCDCGQDLDLQFWKFCPYCAREFKL